MLVAQYAGVGQACPPWGISVESGGSFSASGTLYFGGALENRAGLNQPFVSNAIAYTAGKKIMITIPATTQQPGWDIHSFILSCGTTNDPSTFVQIARVPGFQWGQGIEPQSVRTTLPVTIELLSNDDIALAPTVREVASLPATPLNGAIRWVTASAKWFEYRADSTAVVGTDVLQSSVGRWHRIGSPQTYVGDSRSGQGSDRAITAINPDSVIQTPAYPALISKVLPSWEALYWLYNPDTQVLPAGTEFGIELEFNGRKSPDLLNGLFMVRFLGFVKPDGTIRTTDSLGRTFQNLNAYYPWTPKLTAPFVTSDDLQQGEAIAIGVKPYFIAAELDNAITPHSEIGVLPAIRVQSGDYNPLGKLLPGGAVFSDGDKYRVVAGKGLSIDILSGTAIVASYDFPQKPRRTISGLKPNTAGQQIVINGNAAVYVEPSSYTLTDSEALRAVVSTVSGDSAVGAFSEYVAIASNQGANINVTYPNAIRADYPDVLAGNSKGAFNPPFVKIYLQRQDTGEIRVFSGFGVVAEASQAISISDWSTGTVVSAIPTAAADFSLYAAGGSALALSSLGNFPNASYRAAYSFNYDGNQVSAISHASPPCIKEWDGDFQPASIEVGTVTGLSSDSTPTVINSGTTHKAKFNFGIPQGDKGNKGDKGDVGNKGDKGDAGNKGDKGDKGDVGSPGIVNATSALILNPAMPPTTGANEVGLFVDSADNLLKFKQQSNGNIIVVGSGGGGSAIATQNLEIDYRFDDNSGTQLTDYSGNNRHATIGGSATWLSPAFYGTGLSFPNKNNPFVEIPSYPFFSTVFTLEILFLCQDYSRRWARIFDFAETLTDPSAFFFTINSSANSLPQIFGWNIIPSFPNNSNWAYVQIVSQGQGDYLGFYVNGVYFGSISFGIINSNKIQNYLGKSATSADPYFYGIISAFRYYSKILTPIELANNIIATKDKLVNAGLYINV